MNVYESKLLAKGSGVKVAEVSPELSMTVLIVARVCLLSLILAASSYCTSFCEGILAENILFVYPAIVSLYGFSGLSLWWVLRKGVGRLFVYLQLLVDVFIVTGVVYISGGPISPFLFLYLPLTSYAAVLRTQRTAIAVALCGGLSYSILVMALSKGVVLPADGSTIVPVPERGLLLQITGLISANILIAIATSYLKRKLNISNLLMRKSTQDLSDLGMKQNALMQWIPDGVLMTDSSGRILTTNPEARKTLQLPRPGMGEKSVIEIFQSLPGYQEIRTISDHQVEISYEEKNSSKKRRLLLHQHDVLDEEGNISTSIYIFRDVTRLRSVEEQLDMQERMARMIAESDQETGPRKTRISGFVGESKAMQNVFRLIERVAKSDTTVLIHGESGTGKELVARAVHLGGEQSHEPFVAVNCGAIPENLIESELFGHKKGAFTGAHQDHIGLFRKARQGTIFLDEVGELPLYTQAKLLRALQEKRVRPVGSESDFPFEARIITATNRELKKSVERSEFREDLYYRLNVFQIDLPPLRKRKEDVPLLVSTILKKLCKTEVVPKISPLTMKLLLEYDYPGNVRELENLLERSLVLADDLILPEHVEDLLNSKGQERALEETAVIIDDHIQFPLCLDDFLATVETRYLKRALEKTNGSKKEAARLLGMNFRSFRYRLQKYEMGQEE